MSAWIIAGGYTVTMFTYVTVGSSFLLVDIFHWPKWMRQGQYQPGKNDIIEAKRLISVNFN